MIITITIVFEKVSWAWALLHVHVVIGEESLPGCSENFAARDKVYR